MRTMKDTASWTVWILFMLMVFVGILTGCGNVDTVSSEAKSAAIELKNLPISDNQPQNIGIKIDPSFGHVVLVDVYLYRLDENAPSSKGERPAFSGENGYLGLSKSFQNLEFILQTQPLRPGQYELDVVLHYAKQEAEVTNPPLYSIIEVKDKGYEYPLQFEIPTNTTVGEDFDIVATANYSLPNATVQWVINGQNGPTGNLLHYSFPNKALNKIGVILVDSFGPYPVKILDFRVANDKVILVGPKGDKGDTGPVGPAGKNGKDADSAVIKNLQDQIDAINEILAEHTQEIDSINTDLSLLKSKVAILETDLARVKADLANNNSLISDAQKRIKVLEVKSDPISKQELECLQKIVEGLQDQIDIQNDTILCLQAKITANEESIKALKASLETTDASAKANAKKIDLLKGEIALANQKADNAQSTANLAQQTADTAISAIAYFQTSLDKISAEVGECKNLITSLQKSIDANNKAVQAAQASADKAQKTADDAISKASLNATQIKALQALADANKAELTSQKVSLANLQANVAVAEGRISVLEKAKATAEANIALLQAKTQENQKAIEKAQAQADLAKAEADITIAGLQGQINALDVEVTDLQSKVQTLDQRICALEAELANVRALAQSAQAKADIAESLARDAKATADAALAKCGQYVTPCVTPVTPVTPVVVPVSGEIKNISLSLENETGTSATVYGSVGQTVSMIVRTEGPCNKLSITDINWGKADGYICFVSAEGIGGSLVSFRDNPSGIYLEVTNSSPATIKRSLARLNFRLLKTTPQGKSQVIFYPDWGHIIALYNTTAGEAQAVVNNANPGEIIVK